MLNWLNKLENANEILKKTGQVVDKIKRIDEVALHGYNAKERILSGEAAKEKKVAHEIRCKEDKMWERFMILWIVMMLLTVGIVVFI